MVWRFNEATGEGREEMDPSQLYDYFNADFRFPSEVLTRYVLSLKTKPFVILTGISGTGKTKIAQIFVEYILQGMG